MRTRSGRSRRICQGIAPSALYPSRKCHLPEPLVTTYVATMQSTEGLGKMVRVEAERRGLSRSKMTLAIGDGGNWIDPLIDRERLYDHRIIDYCHAVEHLYEAARAARGKDSPEATRFAEELKEDLGDGRVDALPG